MKQINDYTSRHLTALAMAMLLVGLLCIPAVSAETLYDDDLYLWTDTGGSGSYTHNSGASNAYTWNQLSVDDITKLQTLNYVVIDSEGSACMHTEGIHDMTYTLGGITHNCTLYVEYTRNILGAVTNVRQTIFFDDWNIGDLTGAQKITFSSGFFSVTYSYYDPTITGDSIVWVDSTEMVYGITGKKPAINYFITVSSGMQFHNHIIITDEYNGEDIRVKLIREYPPNYYGSLLNIAKNGTNIYSGFDSTDVDLLFRKDDIDIVTLTVGSTLYTYPITSSILPTDDNSVSVYIRNSQTGALLANANLVISANVNGNFHEVANETVPSGIYSIDLQPTGGGLPNPDFYRLWVTLDGYNSQMPYIDFEVSGGTTVYVYLEPTVGGPEDPNKTYIDVYVRDIYTNPLADATVEMGGYTLKTNSAGYASFEVAKNASYSYSVTKTGYLTIEGIARVESDDRYTVNVALMAGVVPTHTGVTPTITVEPTPTQTTPPIQEDNIIGLSVKGLAKGFGIDYDTALLLFGLMIVFGAGGIVMSSVKGGAMEFIAGSIVGTFVAFALGLIPIWIFIIIAVVFGAYVLRVFIQGGQ